MKKITLVLIAGLVAVLLTACSFEMTGGPNSKDSSKIQNSNSKSKSNESFGSVPSSDYQSDEGDSSNNPKITLFSKEEKETTTFPYSKEATQIYISYSAENFDPNKKTYLYIDDVKLTEKEWGVKTIGSLILKGDALKKGIHILRAVQYDKDQESSKINRFVVKSYTIE